MTDDCRARNAVEPEERQRVTSREETSVASGEVNLRITEDLLSPSVEHPQGIEPLAPDEGWAAHQHMAVRRASRPRNRIERGFNLSSR